MPTTPDRPPATHPASPATSEVVTALAAALALKRKLPRATLVDELRTQVEALQDPLSPLALDTLRRHLPLLEAAFQRFLIDSLNEGRPDHRSILLRTALQAQQAYGRTFALLNALASTPADRRPPAITLEEDR